MAEDDQIAQYLAWMAPGFVHLELEWAEERSGTRSTVVEALRATVQRTIAAFTIG